ncbi:DDE-type integrase/transposase/recombinase [Actinospica durhamensis]|uniref:DDE-type integrase/transposase/recombinase n=2 Tax=Actinospica durhamensis TaxID=1508375 RepID=A0A941EML1_9ACTN|nr:DDE-type integrase/transposase/recombinase [Actinospica durhamensis]
MCMATVIDLFSWRLIGWSIADRHRAELVREALAAAVAARGVTFHSDRGSEYTRAWSLTTAQIRVYKVHGASRFVF